MRDRMYRVFFSLQQTQFYRDKQKHWGVEPGKTKCKIEDKDLKLP